MTEIAATSSPPTGVDADAYTLAYLAAHTCHCPICHYNLTGLTVPRCPECGRRIILRITALAGLTRLWLVSLVGASSALGPASLVVVMLSDGHSLWELVGFKDLQMVLFQALSFGAMITPLAVLVIARLRRVFLRMPYWLQQLFAIVAINFAIAMCLLYFAVLMWVH